MVTVCGHAVSGYGGIASIEVSIDDGPYVEAHLLILDQLLTTDPSLSDALQVREGWSYPFLGVAALWAHEWAATPGAHTVAARAVDRGGQRTRSYLTTVVIENRAPGVSEDAG